MGAPTKILAAMPAADSESDNSSTTSTSSDELFESESGDDASEIRSRKKHVASTTSEGETSGVSSSSDSEEGDDSDLGGSSHHRKQEGSMTSTKSKLNSKSNRHIQNRCQERPQARVAGTPKCLSALFDATNRLTSCPVQANGVQKQLVLSTWAGGTHPGPSCKNCREAPITMVT